MKNSFMKSFEQKEKNTDKTKQEEDFSMYLENLEEDTKSPEFELAEFTFSRINFIILLRRLMPALSEHEYQAVVGDDVSGRIPALVMGKLMKKIYKQEGAKQPETIFLAAGRSHGSEQKKWEEEADSYLDKLLKNNSINSQDKVLLITEFIQTGKSEAQVIELFKNKGITCDLAFLCFEDEFWAHPNFSKPESLEFLRTFRDVKIYKGAFDPSKLFYNKPEIAGVKKRKGKIFSKRRISQNWRTLAARRDSKRMVDYLEKVYNFEKERLQ